MTHATAVGLVSAKDGGLGEEMVVLMESLKGLVCMTEVEKGYPQEKWHQ